MRLSVGQSREEAQFFAEQRRLKKQVLDALGKICVFPGTKVEFEDFIGYETSWVNFDGSVKGLIFHSGVENPFYFYDFSFQKRIIDSGVVALVSANVYYDPPYLGDANFLYFGMPVKKR